MKFNNLAAVVSTAALLAVGAHADEEPKGEATAVLQELPTFIPTKITADFLEQFTDDWGQRWKPSHAKKDTDKDEEEWAYVGEWAVEESIIYKGMEGDKGLVVKDVAAHHAISAKFPQVIDNTGKTLVVQYEVKLQNGLECGGAYMKLLRDTDSLHQDEFSNTTPYVIMFGPDKCGHTNKVHFIFNHKNPKTGKYEEKHLKSPPTANIVKTSELYTLIVHPNNTFIIERNGTPVKEGSLLEDFTPSVNPPEEIDDPTDFKPDEWVDEARIPDPDATKPDDWDEDAPFEIVDEDATMPDDWLEDAPLQVPDPEAEKPEEWNDDEDGDWIPPTVPNPRCAEVSGCGPWSKPMIKNPAYKGKWTAPYIDNPAYKGVWKPRKIPNPDYFEDATPATFEPMGAVGFEIWTMQKNILFDNIYIGHSVDDARAFARESFFVKQAAEKAAEQADKPKFDDMAKSSDVKFLDDPIAYVKDKLDLFVSLAQEDPVRAIKTVPEVAGGLGAVIFTLIALVFSVMGMGGGSAAAPAPVKKAAGDAKEKAKEAKGKAADAVASGVEATKSTTTKRAKAGQS